MSRTYSDAIKMFIIDTMLNFDVEFDGHGHGDVTCKQNFSVVVGHTRTGNVEVNVL